VTQVQGVSGAAAISFVVTGLFLLGWMVFGVVQYRRTGRATWLWLGALMGLSLVAAFVRFPR
jgi:hypothetical protein